MDSLGRLLPDDFATRQSRLTPIVNRLVSDAVWRDDLFDEASSVGWEAAWKAVEDFDPAKNTKMTTWVYGNVRYRLLSWREKSMRQAGRERSVDFDTFPARETRCQEIENEDILALIKFRLTPPQRVLLGHLDSGRTHKEIATMLALKLNTLKSRIYRMRKEIREMFTEDR